MATFAEIANDLDALAASFDGHHLQGEMLDSHALSMRRGAAAIRELLAIKRDLEQAAEEEAERLLRYQTGDDVFD